MRVRVEIWKSADAVIFVGRDLGLVKKGRGDCIAAYEMDHDNESERRVLGEQCRNAFEAGQTVIAYPVSA